MRFFVVVLILLFSSVAIPNSDNKVSLRHKIGQMLLIGFDGKNINSKSKIVEVIQKNNIGGVLLFDYNFRTKTHNKNIESPKQVKKLNNDLQYYNKQGHLKYQRPNLPLLISVDYEGGQINRLAKQYGFPPTFSAAYIGNQPFKEAEIAAESMALTLKEGGFNLDFAPVLDVKVNTDNPVIGKKDRSFSTDPAKVYHFAKIYTQHFLNHNIQCVYKHFPGHGSSTTDSHVGFVDVTNTWRPSELEPYKNLFNTNDSCGMIMTAHIVNRQLDQSGLPATLSYQILTRLLRQKLHFNGVIITDDMQMKAISDNYSLDRALALAINAGADMLIFGNNLSVSPQDPEQVIDIIANKVLSGEISRERIDNAYQHIVALKQTLKNR